MGFTSNYLTCAGREIHYTEWGAQHGETVIAWHGLARTGRDMDEVAEHLSQRYRVLEEETSTGAVLSTTASLVTVSLVMTVLAGR